MTTSAALATTLAQLNVHFVVGQAEGAKRITKPPHVFLSALASSDEARMRLALIPLFLAHPHYAGYVTQALKPLTPAQRQVLRCYYTAAQLLQQKYRSELMALLGSRSLLPDLFESALGLDVAESLDVRLRQLADRQARLSGRPINWYGTYEHAYARFVHHAKQRKQWQ